jgi:hypothetical protein
MAIMLPYVFVCLSAYKVFFDYNKTRFIACIGALSTSAIFAMVYRYTIETVIRAFIFIIIILLFYNVVCLYLIIMNTRSTTK